MSYLNSSPANPNRKANSRSSFLTKVVALAALTTGLSVSTAQAQNTFQNNGSNVGIGTTSPVSKLTIEVPSFTTYPSALRVFRPFNLQQGTALSHMVEVGAINFGGTYSSFFNVHTSGNVGIGVVNPSGSTPYAKLLVQQASSPNAKTLQLQNTSLRKIFFANRLGTDGYNGLSENYDMGLFWSDQTSGNNSAGLVIAPESAGTLNGVRIGSDGKVAMGVEASETTGGYRLFVADGILTEKVRVAQRNSSEWPDFVFADDYELRSLQEIREFITANHHLPEVPSAAQVAQEGIDLGKMDATLLRKVEELTLYILAQDEKMEKLQAELDALKTSN